VQVEYQSKVELLLAATSFPGLTSEQLSAFKAANSSSVYVCRFPGCISIVAGFATLESRAQHEKAHAPPLVCMHSGCKYRLAFGSLQSLNRHIKDFHESGLRRVPRSIRRNNNVNSVPGVSQRPFEVLPHKNSVARRIQENLEQQSQLMQRVFAENRERLARAKRESEESKETHVLRAHSRASVDHMGTAQTRWPQ
jgi:hypothetical protein